LVGAAEAGQGDPLLARIVAPLAKLACARQALSVCSELVGSFGGAGYLEDTGIPVLFRDAHVQVIWEGTSSVMAHDVLRALRMAQTRDALHDDLRRRLVRADHPGLAATVAQVIWAAAQLHRLTVEADEATPGRWPGASLAPTRRCCCARQQVRTPVTAGSPPPPASSAASPSSWRTPSPP
jgi:hypothetical protein